MAFSDAILFAPAFFLIGLIQAYTVVYVYHGTGGRKKKIQEPALNAAVPFICLGFGLFVMTSFVALPEDWGVAAVAVIAAVLLMGLVRGMRVHLTLEDMLSAKAERRSLIWAVITVVICMMMFTQQAA
jgi:uncharacterized membrane protein